jgi:beta-phosphoglucomutase-like phosphatase (HAD superfamily)
MPSICSLELPKHGYDAVIFDCDGTLVDSMPAHFQGWIEAFAAHGAHDVLDEREYLDLGGVPGRAIIAHVNRRNGLDLDVESVLQLKRSTVAALIPGLKALEPAASWLRWCRARGIPVAVASGGVSPIVRASLAAAGLADLIDPQHIFTAETVSRGKPAPDLFLAAAARLGVAPAACLVVEDGPPGIAAAAAAGMRCIDIRDWNPTPAEDARAGTA